MPEITLMLDEGQHLRLNGEYKRMSMAWLRSRPDAPPSFEQWLSDRLASPSPSSAPAVRQAEALREELRAVDAIEKLVTSLQAHGFALAQIDRRERDDAASALAGALAAALKLSPARSRRLAELAAYYARSPREVADAGGVGVTQRAQTALIDACRALAERTLRIRDRLGPERALGRIEGSLAIVMMLHVISRQTGREQAEAFRRRLEEHP
ncbi:MAG TPA: hypothetical protein VM406_13465 [Noviherbaspirillum sp.]|nr:hypothetical protein [Noviherbaspirillum sp.]